MDRSTIDVPSRGICALWIGASLLASCASVSADEPFSAGQQLRLVAAGEAGGGLDAYARLVERHLSKVIPGRPTNTVNNLPGASGLTGANHLYTTAPRDGLIIGAIPSSTLLEPLWFRDDLRLSDQPALLASIKTGQPVLFVFLQDDGHSCGRALGGAQRWWLHHSLAALSRLVAREQFPTSPSRIKMLHWNSAESRSANVLTLTPYTFPVHIRERWMSSILCKASCAST